MNLTRADRDALKRLPKGWFVIGDVDFMVRCPRARCERLEHFGLVESEVVGDISDFSSIHSRYRLTKAGSAQIPTP